MIRTSKRTPPSPRPPPSPSAPLRVLPSVHVGFGWQIAAELCVYTNNSFTVHSLDVEEDESDA